MKIVSIPADPKERNSRPFTYVKVNRKEAAELIVMLSKQLAGIQHGIETITVHGDNNPNSFGGDFTLFVDHPLECIRCNKDIILGKAKEQEAGYICFEHMTQREMYFQEMEASRKKNK